MDHGFGGYCVAGGSGSSNSSSSSSSSSVSISIMDSGSMLLIFHSLHQSPSRHYDSDASFPGDYKVEI